MVMTEIWLFGSQGGFLEGRAFNDSGLLDRLLREILNIKVKL